MTETAGAALPEVAPCEPRDGVPEVIVTVDRMTEYADALAVGSGPLALDAERASGFRYSQRAYLIQLRRAGAGTALIDPIAVPDLDRIQQATAGVEWILHAATQDLACLHEVGLHPERLFDTELAGRLLGRERVSLAALVASELGQVLEKGHGATDWSQRPLSAAQLRYAALDVELLVELRDHLETELRAADKWTWAQEEFAALVGFEPKERRVEPWRRTSGLHRIRKPRALAVVRALWQARDRVGAQSDIAVGRVLPDAAIIAVAQAMPTTIEALGSLPEFRGRGQQRRLRTWWAAVEAALTCPDDDLPGPQPRTEGPPPPRAWADKDPIAARRLEDARAALGEIAQAHTVPVENVLAPELVRRVCWQPPGDVSPTGIAAALQAGGARPWQIGLAAEAIAAACATS